MYRKLEEKTTGIPLFGSLEFRQDWSFAHVDILGKPREHRPKFDLDKKKCINPKMDNFHAQDLIKHCPNEWYSTDKMADIA